MTKGRKINMLMAIDRMDGNQVKEKVYYAGLLEAMYFKATLAAKEGLTFDEKGNPMGGAKQSVQIMILEEFNRLSELTGTRGGFQYGSINGEKKDPKKKVAKVSKKESELIKRSQVADIKIDGDLNKLKGLLASLKK